MKRYRIAALICGAILIAGAGVLLARWFQQKPHRLGLIENEYPWKKATISVDGQDHVVKYCKFGSGVPIEAEPYWKQTASTPEEAAAAQLTCLRTGGTIDDYLKLYAKPEEIREYLAATYGSIEEFVKSNREIRKAMLLGTLIYNDLHIVVVKVAVNDGPAPWVVVGLCYTENNGDYRAIRKPNMPVIRWLSKNGYLLKQSGDGK